MKAIKQSSNDLFNKANDNAMKLIGDYENVVNLLHNLNDYDTELFTRCSDMIGMFAEIYDYTSNDLEDLIADLNERLVR